MSLIVYINLVELMACRRFGVEVRMSFSVWKEICFNSRSKLGYMNIRIYHTSTSEEAS